MNDAAHSPDGSTGVANSRRILHAAPGRGRILIVEDEWLVSSEIECLLTEQGYEICGCAVSADEAVDLAARHRPDLILMDIRLKSHRDGIDAALDIRQANGARCLFISANSDPGNQARAAPADPVGWLPKPFASRRLIEAVAAALEEIRR